MYLRSCFIYILLLFLGLSITESSGQVMLKLQLRDISHKDKILPIYQASLGKYSAPLVAPIDIERLINDTLRATHPQYQFLPLPALQSDYKISAEDELTITIEALPKHTQNYFISLNIAGTDKPSPHKVEIDFCSRQPLKKLTFRSLQHKKIATITPRLSYKSETEGLYYYEANMAYADLKDGYLCLPQSTDTFFIRAQDFYQPIYLLKPKAKPISEQEAHLLAEYFDYYTRKEKETKTLTDNYKIEKYRLTRQVDKLRDDTFYLGGKLRELRVMLADCQAGRLPQPIKPPAPLPPPPLEEEELFIRAQQEFRQDYIPRAVDYSNINNYFYSFLARLPSIEGIKTTNRIVLLVELSIIGNGYYLVPQITEVHCPESLNIITENIKTLINQTEWMPIYSPHGAKINTSFLLHILIAPNVAVVAKKQR